MSSYTHDSRTHERLDQIIEQLAEITDLLRRLTEQNATKEIRTWVNDELKQ